ncbi:MAG: hypothetical protein L6455_13850 [Kiritimatiellae bacterium]|nr:hypothetical protein [Kiritimatiellia bacterium]
MNIESSQITGRTIFKGFLWILGAAATLYAFHMHVKQVVENYANSPEFISKIASETRPSLIFDQNFSIIADEGGSKYVDNIEIMPPLPEHPTQMIVRANTHLSHEPFLESMSANEYLITASRGKKHDWVFRLKPHGTVGDEKRVFRIEIIR